MAVTTPPVVNHSGAYSERAYNNGGYMEVWEKRVTPPCWALQCEQEEN